MATVSKQLQGNSNAPVLKLTVDPQPYDIENNRTPVKYAFMIERPLAISSSTAKSYSIKIGGNTFTGKTSVGGSGTKIITSGTVWIPHNADGSKTINFSFSIDIEITWDGTYNGTVSNSASTKLPNIPRATQPTVNESVLTIGDTVTISMARASSSFTHNLKLQIGDYVTTIGTGLGVSKQYVLPLSLMNEITEGVSSKAKIWCETYRYDEHIGSKSVDVTLKVPISIVPSVSSVTLTELNQDVTIGEFVQGYSKVRVAVTASGQYGSTIKSISSTLDGVSYKGATFDTETLFYSGTKNIETIAKDSRGRAIKKVTPVKILEYFKPKTIHFTVERCDASGNLIVDGQYAKISYHYSIAPLNNKNSKRIVFEYSDGGNYSLIKELTANFEETSSFITGAIFNVDKSYDVRMTVSDVFSSSSVYDKIETDKTTFDVHSSGQGMAFGKVAEEADLFDVAWNAKFRKGLQTESLTDSTYATAPTTDGTKYLGTSSNKWRAIYSSNATIQPSDRRLKHDIAPIDERYINLFNELKPVNFKRIDGDRVHLGFIAQEVKEAMEKSNLSDMEFAGYCADLIGDDYTYSLRYEEFIALNTQVIQMLLAQTKEMKDQMKELQQQLERISHEN